MGAALKLNSVTILNIRQDGNALDAAAQGAMQGVALIGNIVANIVAFMAFIAFLDAIVAWLGNLVGLDYLSFQVKVSYFLRLYNSSDIQNEVMDSEIQNDNIYYSLI